MTKVADLLKLHGLYPIKQLNHIQSTMTDESIASLHSTYGEVLKVTKYENTWRKYTEVYVTLECPKDGCGNRHGFYQQQDKSWAYSWPGSSYLGSKTPIPLDVLHTVIKAKTDELADARRKRFEKIQSPRDAVRVAVRDMGIKCNMVNGHPRVDCGPYDIEFAAGTEADPKVVVTMVYQSGRYVHKKELVTLSVADPGFNEKVEAIAFNGTNLAALMLGQVQPKSLPA